MTLTGDELRRRRYGLGLKQRELAETLGVPRSTLARWELGSVRMQHPRIIDLALQRLELAARARG